MIEGVGKLNFDFGKWKIGASKGNRERGLDAEARSRGGQRGEHTREQESLDFGEFVGACTTGRLSYDCQWADGRTGSPSYFHGCTDEEEFGHTFCRQLLQVQALDDVNSAFD